MKLIVSGKTQEFTPELQKKFDTKLSKLSKFIEQRGEREAHLTHQVERHLHKIELSVNFYDHSLVGEGSGFRFGYGALPGGGKSGKAGCESFATGGAIRTAMRKAVRSTKKAGTKKPLKRPRPSPPRAQEQNEPEWRGRRSPRFSA